GAPAQPYVAAGTRDEVDALAQSGEQRTIAETIVANQQERAHSGTGAIQGGPQTGRHLEGGLREIGLAHQLAVSSPVLQGRLLARFADGWTLDKTDRQST